MNRRRYLATGFAASGLVAGCLALPDGGSTPTQRPRISVIERAELPDIPVRPSVEITAPEASDEAPPELRATVENTADYPIEVGEERAIVFAFVYSEAQPGLQLLPTDGDYQAVEPGCWRLAESVVVAEYYGVVSLEPGETTERRLGVWASPDGEGCLPNGEFRFETQYAGARDREAGIEDEEWRGSWSFTLDVE